MSSTKTIALAALAVAATTMALPASAECVRRSDAGANGAVIGALAGAAIGNGTAGRHSKGTGTVAGALVGAVVGSSIARGNTHCDYGYYDDSYDNGYREDSRYDDNDRYDDGYSYTRVYVQPRTVYVEPRPYYRERVYMEPHYGYGYHRHYHYRQRGRW